MAKKDEKTNVMRILEQKNIPYTPHAYDGAAGLDGVSVARQLGQDPESAVSYTHLTLPTILLV